MNTDARDFGVKKVTVCAYICWNLNMCNAKKTQTIIAVHMAVVQIVLYNHVY